jgi:hypothetical protein
MREDDPHAPSFRAAIRRAYYDAYALPVPTHEAVAAPAVRVPNPGRRCICRSCNQDRAHFARGMCKRCYQVAQRRGDLEAYQRNPLEWRGRQDEREQR